ncbi:hypothetical protein ABIF83_002611 [Bradyrhizobium ottawaense]|nr:hypothetical protein TM102_37270 [Bradyrhizobium sp. TM102]
MLSFAADWRNRRPACGTVAPDSSNGEGRTRSETRIGLNIMTWPMFDTKKRIKGLIAATPKRLGWFLRADGLPY